MFFGYRAMMLQHGLSITTLLLSAGLAATGLQQSNGWLDKVVQFQKNKLFDEIKESVPINVNVELRPKSVGYEDSRHWDYNSVVRLLSLIRKSETAKPILKALRRMLQPTRRIMMSIKQSLQMFPSLKKDDNNFYYDIDYTSGEENAVAPADPVPEDQAVIVVSNPVEARLPSARISVKLLREILEARARSARQMPTTTAKIPWEEFIKNRTLTSTEAGSTNASADDSTDAADGDQTANDDSESTTAADGGDNPESDAETGAGDDEDTTGADTETTSEENKSAETASEDSTPEETTPEETAPEEPV